MRNKFGEEQNVTRERPAASKTAQPRPEPARHTPKHGLY